MNWSEPRTAPATLRSDTPITPWRFALHFIAEFEEWRRAKSRWARLFGAHRLPRHWITAEERCVRVSERVALYAPFAYAFQAERVALRLASDYPDQPLDPDSGFDRIMEAQRIYHLASFVGSRPGYQGLMPRFPDPEQIQDTLRRQLSFLPSSGLSNLEWNLAHYRSALLLARCLEPDKYANWPTHLTLEKRLHMKLSDLITSTPALSVKIADEMREPLNTIGDLISELGFEGTCEHLTSSDFDSLPIGTADRLPINVIPSRGGGTCASMVVALLHVAGDRRKEHRFRSIMAEFKAHLVRCQDATKNAILITDWWDSEVFAHEHAKELAEWNNKGIQILPLLVSQPGSVISPIRM